jgi:integrase
LYRGKEISAIKRVLQLAVLRDQLEKNPFKHLRRPKIPEQEIHIYDDDECHRLLRAAREGRRAGGLNWELLIAAALCTGWTTENGKCPVNNVKRKFDKILKRGSIDEGEFHDLRRTCMTRWFANGLTEFDVMKLAGHSDFATTHRFYLAARRDLIEKARVAAAAAMTNDFGTHLARAPVLDEKGLTVDAGRC